MRVSLRLVNNIIMLKNINFYHNKLDPTFLILVMIITFNELTLDNFEHYHTTESLKIFFPFQKDISFFI